MKKYILLISLVFTLFIVLIPTSCKLDINEPSSMRFSVELTVIDTSLDDSDSLVALAEIIMQSITYGDKFEAVTNTEGKAIIHDLLPDTYNILASGNRLEGNDIILINGQIQDTSLYIENNDTLNLKLIAQTSISSALVISEIYYSGAKSIIPQYFHDQFTELYNNSNEVLYLDSLIIADLEYGFIDDSLFHVNHAYMFPGTGKDYPINPGEFIIIAQDAIDHSIHPVNTVDLTVADFEYYVADKGDVDNANVPNMLQIHHRHGNDFLYSVFSNAIIIIDVEDPYEYGYDEFNRLLLPKEGVLDGVEYRDNPAEMDKKRLDTKFDAGLTGGIPSYSSQSIERFIDRYEEGRMILMDNNNSALDFHINKPPTPGWVEEATQ